MKDIITSNDSFVPVNNQNVDAVIQILESRLPKSANMYNMALISKIVPADVKLFLYLNNVSPSALIILTAFREDYGTDISISVPDNFIATEELKEALSTTQAIDWEKPYLFSSLDPTISTTILEISTSIKENGTQCLPHYYFYIDRSDAKKLGGALPPGFQNKPLKNEDGVDFLVNTWKFSKEGTREYLQRVTKLCPSSGIYDLETGLPASGIMMNFSGLMGMLYSSDKYRGKGLAQLCMKTLLKQAAELGFIPTSSCEIKNVASTAFHLKVGMTLSHKCADIIYSGSKW